MTLLDASADQSQPMLPFLAYAQRTYPDFPKDFTFFSSSDPTYMPSFSGNQVIYTSAITTAIAVTVVAARLTARHIRTHGKLAVDDWLIVAAVLAQLGYCVVQVCAVKYGCVGYNVYDCNVKSWVTGFRLRYAGLLLSITTAMMIRLSVAFFCLRLIHRRPVIDRRIITFTIFFLVVSYIASFFHSAFLCSPVQASWDIQARVDQNAQCPNEWRSVLAWDVIYSLQDIWLLIIPLWIVIKQSLLKKTPIGLFFVFSFALAASVCSIVKLSGIKKAYDSYNPTWNSVPVLVFSQLECSLGLIAASLPALSNIVGGNARRSRRRSSSRRNRAVSRTSTLSTTLPAKEPYLSETPITSDEPSPTTENYPPIDPPRTNRWPALMRSLAPDPSPERNRDGARSGQGQNRDLRSGEPFDGFQPPVIATTAEPWTSPSMHAYQSNTNAITRTIRINQSVEASNVPQPFQPLTFDPPSVFRIDLKRDIQTSRSNLGTSSESGQVSELDLEAGSGPPSRYGRRPRPASTADDMSIDLVIQGHHSSASESESTMSTIYEGKY